VKVRKALFELARNAAEMVASNEKLLELLQQKRLEAITEIAGRAGGIAASAWTLISAFTFTTEVSVGVAPVSAWLASGPLVVTETVVAACANPLLAVAAGCFALWHLGNAWAKYDENQKLRRQVTDYEYGENLFRSDKQCTSFEQSLTSLPT